MDKGWVKLSRNITDNWIWQNHEYAYAFIDLLLMVNHEEKKILINGKLKTINKGQCWTSIVKLATKWGWSRNRVSGFLATLESDGMIATERTPYGTALTVVNWAKYQVREQQTKQPTKQRIKQPTEQQTEQQTKHKQECIKNEKKVKKENLPSEADQQAEEDKEFWEKLCNDEIDIEVNWDEVDMSDV